MSNATSAVEVTFVTVEDTWTALFDQYLISLGVDLDAGVTEYQGCECELDWNCGCGRYGGFTFLETRYQGMDEDEARAFGVYEREFEVAV